jgi:AbrB family looped-hinge helix DNA binding protein
MPRHRQPFTMHTQGAGKRCGICHQPRDMQVDGGMPCRSAGRKQRFHLAGKDANSYHTPIDGDRLMASQDVAALSRKFQISIPKAVCSARKWQPGQKFAFIPKDGGVMLVPVPRQEDLAGSMRGLSEPE